MNKNAKKTNFFYRIKYLIHFFKDQRFKNISGLILIFLSIYLTISFISYFFTWKHDQSLIFDNSLNYLIKKEITAKNFGGKLGAILSHFFLFKSFGISSFYFNFLLFLSGLYFLKNNISFHKNILLPLFFLSIWLSIFLGFIFGKKIFYLGGAYGIFISEWLSSALGYIGTLFLLIIIGFSFILYYYKKILTFYQKLLLKLKPSKTNLVNATIENENNINSIQTNSSSITKEDLIGIEKKSQDSDDIELIIENTSKIDEQIIEETNNYYDEESFGKEFNPRNLLPSYQFPSIDLLNIYENEAIIGLTEKEHKENKEKIINTLNNFGIQIQKIHATVGPTVTLYEIVPSPGVKISKIKSLEDDMALSLSALGIRIIAPIPGKGTIGIEIPNKQPQIVSLRSLLLSKEFKESNYNLPIALGKTIQNDIFILDLTKCPHLLVAGATGTGKSVGLNVIISSLLFKKHPAELKFVIIDPKKIEMVDYKDISDHFLAMLPNQSEPIINQVNEAKIVLKSLTKEMDFRYSLLKKAGGVRNINEYNLKVIKRELNINEFPYLPYIVVIIDEFADLFMIGGREIEESLARLAQLARAIGIHLVVATQRPSTNVITGLIKANFPVRIAFRVAQMIDSRTIIDAPGANRLIGNGDMLITIPGGELKRIQCAYISANEVINIVNHIKNQPKPPMPYLLPEVEDEQKESISIDDPNNTKIDDLFKDVATYVVLNQTGSTSKIQREFQIGFNRAGRIMDQLEKFKIVGPQEGSKPRKVLVSSLDELNQIFKQLNIN